MEREMSKKTAKKKNVMVEENKVDKLLTAVFGSAKEDFASITTKS